MATTEISRTVIIPEIDAYTFAEVASHGTLVTGTIDKPLEALNAGLLHFDNHEVPAENQIILVSPTFLNALRNSSEIYKTLLQTDYDKNVKFRMSEYEGRKIAMVPPQRFNTEVKLERGGYRVTGNPIDFMIVAKDAVTHVVKYNKVKVISGELNLASQNFDGYTIFARVYHDVFVPKNKEIAIYVHTGGYTYTGAATGTAQLDVKVKDGKIAKLNILPANLFVKFYKASSAPTVGEVLSSLGTEVIVGSAASTGDHIYAVDSVGRVVAVTEVK